MTSVIKALYDGLAGNFGSLAQANVERAAEMKELGFDTDSQFDLDGLNEYVGSRAFTVTSETTHTEYIVVVRNRNRAGGFDVGVEVYRGEDKPSLGRHLVAMQLTQADNGTMRFDPPTRQP